VVPEMGVTDWPSGAHAPLAGFAIQADAPLARVVGFAPLSLTVEYVGDHDELQVLRFAQDDNEQSFNKQSYCFDAPVLRRCRLALA
jgi:hypothetical protein